MFLGRVIKTKKIFIVFVLFIENLLIPLNIKAQVVINEFVPDSTQEWVEFYNASDSADYLKTYYVDDDIDFVNDSGSSAKKVLTNINCSNPTFPTIDTSSFLNNSGDWVVLFDSSGLLIDKYEYKSNPGKDVSIGRYPDLNGSFSILAYSTKADANASPPTPEATSTPTNTATPTETPTSSPSPTSSPIKTPTPTPKKTPTLALTSIATSSATPQEDVLGEKTTLPSLNTSNPMSTPIENDQKSVPTMAIVLVVLGLGFIGFAIFSMIKNAKKESSNIS